MYPARWFPVSGYTTDRFSADLRVTVPVGYTVLGSGERQQGSRRRQDALPDQVRAAVFPRQHRHREGAARARRQRRRHHLPVFPRRRSRYGAGLRRADRQDDVVLHRHVRSSAVRQPHRRRNRRGRAQRLCGARHDLPGAARHRQAGQHQAAGQPGRAPVVRGTGLARHAQSPVAHQRAGRLCRTALERARKRSGRHGSRSCATSWWNR